MRTYNIPNITLIARALRQRTTAEIYYDYYVLGTRPRLRGTRSQILKQARSLAQQYNLDTTIGLHQYVTPLEKSDYHQQQHDTYLAGITSDIVELLSELDEDDRTKVLQALKPF